MGRTRGRSRLTLQRGSLRSLVAVTVLLLSLPSVVLSVGDSIAGAATAGVVTNYPDPSLLNPYGITAGPDGALWFTNSGNNSIGRISTAGAITSYGGSGISAPFGIAAGPDGALWFTNQGNNSIGRITTSGVVTNYTGTGINAPYGITAGSDGALWFANDGNGSIGRITTSGVVTNFTDPTIVDPIGIVAGPDGALWFTNNNGSIGRITTSGVVTNYTGTGIASPYGITVGPDGALWFTNEGNGSIGRITTSGVVTNYTDPTISEPDGITAGPDGALWFVNTGNNSIGRITTSGVVTNFTDPTISFPAAITAGPDDAMWFTNTGNGSVGRITTDVILVPPPPAPSPLSISTTSLPMGPISQSYSATLAASGGTTPYTWSIASGSLPAGLSLDPTTGVISGTPHHVGSSVFTVEVTDSTSPTPETATALLSVTAILPFRVTTHTALQSYPNPGQPGYPGPTYTARVTSSPSESLGGTVTFTDDGSTICTSVITATNSASCTAAYPYAEQQSIGAVYQSGSSLVGDSTANFVEQMNGAPWSQQIAPNYIWNGYMQYEAPLNIETDYYTGIKGTFTVPTVSNMNARCPSTVTAAPCWKASIWLGIGGINGNLIQAGVNLDMQTSCSFLCFSPHDTVTPLSAFTETLTPGGGGSYCPSSGTTTGAQCGFSNFTIHQGDIIQVAIVEESVGQWLVTVEDVTTDQTQSRTIVYEPLSNSAEAILERTNGASSATGPALTPTSNVVFSSVEATTENGSGWQPFFQTPNVSFITYAMSMMRTLNSYGTATPSDVNGAGDGFQVVDGAIFPAPPPPSG